MTSVSYIRLPWDSNARSLLLIGVHRRSSAANCLFPNLLLPTKTFPANATLKANDPRLRPGMSASAEIIIERHPNKLLIPARASFEYEGKPAVYVQTGKGFVLRPIEVGKRNEEDIIVTGGLIEDEIVTLESPTNALKRTKRK